MSQTTVTRHYQFRKRNVQHVDETLKSTKNIVTGDGDTTTAEKKAVKSTKTTVPKTVKTTSKSQTSAASKPVTKKKPASQKNSKKTAATDKKLKENQSTIKTFFTDTSKTTKPAKCFSCVSQQRVSSPFNATGQSSPKRSPSNLPEEGSPSKKRHLENNDIPVEVAVDKPKAPARRKLQLDSHSAKSVSDVPKDKIDALIDQTRIKLISNPNIGELKEALQLFSEKTTKLKKLQSNPFMINCVASSDKTLQKKKPIPSEFACEKFQHLSGTEPLVLPLKYKELSDLFRSMDALVARMHNRKESVTFDALKDGMQTTTKRDFSKVQLGQMVTVFPSAYNLSVEKTSCISKGNNSSDYQLIISPNLITHEGSKKKTATFQAVNPIQLICRANEFNKNLLQMVKTHHQDYLKKINFDTASKDSIKRWHPKFPVDSVPDIPVALLPELPQTKISSAKDVLNKVKGSFRSKAGKTLQSVTEETQSSSRKPEVQELSNTKPMNSADLKGICVDLLEKIRGKESALALKSIIETPSERKELEMLDRVPKLVNIVYLYFISERKAAIHIDLVVEKIIHSLNSLLTPDEVKEDLKFVQEKFPSWLKFVQIPKGVYLTLNKSIHINRMLDDAGIH